MAGIFGAVSKENCIEDIVLGSFYLQDRAQDYCGIAWKNETLEASTHKGLLEANYESSLKNMKTSCGIGTVSSERSPTSELSNTGGLILAYDGNIANSDEIKNNLLKEGASFSGHHNPKRVSDGVLISKIISKETSFEKGIERLSSQLIGDYSILALSKEGIYAARGWGRKPLILGRHKEKESYAVSSESVSFINLDYSIERDVKPGEIVLLDEKGFHHVTKLDLQPIKYGTFEWIYTAHPSSVIDGKSVELVRNSLGEELAKKIKNKIQVDIVSPIPDSGRCHATGLANVLSKELNIDYLEVFKKFPYCGRSFTPNNLKDQMKKAERKLIPVESIIKDKRILLVDDSIVKGNQTRKQTQRLKDLGAKEVYAAIACPPLMAACKYGKSIQKDDECIAKVMDIEQIRKTRGLDGLFYAGLEDLEKAIGKPREELCLECWDLE
ncbi:MAG: amidophosphoribosyltransferase [Nanoarchaeota archaeon]